VPPTAAAAPAAAVAAAAAAPPPPLASAPPPTRRDDADAGRQQDAEALLTPTMVELAPRGGVAEGRRVALIHLRPPRKPPRPASPPPASGEGEEEDEGEVCVFLMHGGTNT